jgi:hypothetical protein
LFFDEVDLLFELLALSFVDLTLRWRPMRQAWWLVVEGYMLMLMIIILIQFQTTGHSFSSVVVSSL